MKKQLTCVPSAKSAIDYANEIIRHSSQVGGGRSQLQDRINEMNKKADDLAKKIRGYRNEGTI
jgi:hypothetical protein